MRKINNPLLPGFYPDPSICRVGQDYYMVTSSFEFYPGIPLFHSRDLVNWHQLGHVLDRYTQLNLDHVKPSQGIYAATIRHNKGIFYVITTLVKDPNYSGNINFYVTAENPEGPWSEPIYIKDAPGIDSSLFFDDEKVYYTGNLRPYPDRNDDFSRHIWMQELDIEKKQLIGERHILLTDGALRGAKAPEAPHLYKINDWYYLLIAEGGTSHDHAITIFRSKYVKGPYEINPRNPIMTHRHLGLTYPINSTGHGDLIQTQNGEWWMVMLASRPIGGYYRNLGRETFIAPVIWEEGWPIVSPGIGKVEFSYPAPNLEECRWPKLPGCDHFESEKLDDRWNFIRTPRDKFWNLTDRESFLRMKLKKESLNELVSPAFIGRRQQHINFMVHTAMEFTPNTDNEAAGLVMFQNNNFHMRMEYTKKNNMNLLHFIKRIDGKDEILAEKQFETKRLYLKIETYAQAYNFYYATTLDEWNLLIKDVDGTILSREVAGGFTGAYIGLYATSMGEESNSFVDFDWFEYREI